MLKTATGTENESSSSNEIQWKYIKVTTLYVFTWEVKGGHFE